MKVKLDFITNSSTTCFVVIGARLELKDIPEEFVKNVEQRENVKIDMQEEIYEYMDYFLKESDLDYSTGSEYDDDQLMVGIPFTKMKDDETLAQFRRRVKLQTLECLGVKINPYYIEEAWRDG